MSFYDRAVWLICEEVGCDVGVQADSRHLANLTASGGWYCPRHDDGGDDE